MTNAIEENLKANKDLSKRTDDEPPSGQRQSRQ